VHQLTLVGWGELREKDKTAKKFRPARPQDEQAIRDALARIEKLGSEANGETAIYCYSMLAALNYSLGEYSAVEKHARKIISLDAKNQSAWEKLLQSLVLQERNADYLQEAQALAKTLPTSRNCFLLAKALAANQRFELAENACAPGLKTDVNCQLGMAALMMRKGDDATTPKAAENLLIMARQNCRPEDGAIVYTELEYLSAVHQALSGGDVIARLKLQRLQEENPDNPRYEKLLNALGR
jgi:hypothetical protein